MLRVNLNGYHQGRFIPGMALAIAYSVLIYRYFAGKIDERGAEYDLKNSLNFKISRGELGKEGRRCINDQQRRSLSLLSVEIIARIPRRRWTCARHGMALATQHWRYRKPAVLT